MTFTRAVQFYRKYEGLLTDDEILAETGYSADRIRRQIIKTRGQLCWTCANACDDSKCEWVWKCNETQYDTRINNYPDYVETKIVTKVKRAYNSDTEYIIKCEKYKWDGKSK